MKRIINNKKYDTETATLIDTQTNNMNKSDYHYCSESLYQKRTGEFFLFVENGGLPMKYDSPIFDPENNIQIIIAINIDIAKKWLSIFSTVEIYEKLFGEVEE